jgi:hypothetical protein
MPCDSIRTISVDLSAVGKISPELLMAALRATGETRVFAATKTLIRFGYDGEWIDTETGKSNLSSYRNADALKQAYGAEVVKAKAKQYGWQLKETEQFKYQIVKR